MKNIIFAFAIFVSGGLLTPEAKADEPFLCITPEGFAEGNAAVDLVKYQCADVARIAKGLEVAAIGIEAGSIYFACTGVGAAISVALQGTAIGVQTIRMVVGNLPCEDRHAQEIETQVKRYVCDQLIRQGLICQE